jgi:AraC family transcriptional regulator of adaptative response / DNA-3-methyladenine glycosylase II
MPLDPDSCYRALAARDRRFDGKFFVGVSSTRIYCRPVCSVRLPRRENCTFYASAAAAEVNGLRPCLRCRPELAPGNAGIDATARLAQAAVSLIENGALDGTSIDALATRVGITPRHLRRIFASEFGVAPIEFAQTQRLLLAKRLLTDTKLPVTDVALASGFASLRRFNALFKERYRMAPGRLRKDAADGATPGRLSFELAYRPPYDWDALTTFLAARAIAGVEEVTPERYRRSIAIEVRGTRHTGWIEVRRAPRRSALAVDVSPSLAKAVPAVLGRVKYAFDLSCDPTLVAAALGELAADHPGLRVPGTVDGFELAVRAVVGQQITVRAARTMLGRIAAAFGDALDPSPAPAIARLFPTATRIAACETGALTALGITTARARTLIALAQAVAQGHVELTPGGDVEATLRALKELPGIGEWTAQYIAMRALGWPDAFLASDLIVRRAMNEERPARVLAASEAWRPWRAYAVLHLWRKAT